MICHEFIEIGMILLIKLIDRAVSLAGQELTEGVVGGGDYRHNTFSGYYLLIVRQINSTQEDGVLSILLHHLIGITFEPSGCFVMIVGSQIVILTRSYADTQSQRHSHKE